MYYKKIVIKFLWLEKSFGSCHEMNLLTIAYSLSSILYQAAYELCYY
jgi:hypothetical protein